MLARPRAFCWSKVFVRRRIPRPGKAGHICTFVGGFCCHVVRFSCALVVMPCAFVRSCSFVAVFPALGRLVISVRSLADFVVTLRVVRFSCAPVGMRSCHLSTPVTDKWMPSARNADSSMSIFF